MGPLRGAAVRAEPLERAGGERIVSSQGRRGRKALPEAGVQPFTERSTREPPSPLGQTRLLDADLVRVIP